MNVRKADVNNPKDVNALLEFRVDYFSQDNRTLTQAEETQMRAQIPEYFSRKLGKELTAFIGEIDGVDVGTAFLLMIEKPANPVFLNGKTGMILNVYTSPKYRGKGVATKVMTALLDEAKAQGMVYIELFATSQGRYVYEKLGFFENIPKDGYKNMKFNFVND